MHASNTELVAAIIDGEIHRYGEVVHRFDARIRQTVANKISDPAIVEDLVQETFYKAFKQLEKLSDPGRLENWLVSISKHCIADFYRRRNSVKSQAMGLDLQSNEIESQTESSSNPIWIWEEVGKLDSAKSQVLHLRYLLSLTYAEIAQRMAVPESTVRGRIFEARNSLRKRLTEKRLYP